jgi:hypothetical protein
MGQSDGMFAFRPWHAGCPIGSILWYAMASTEGLTV